MSSRKAFFGTFFLYWEVVWDILMIANFMYLPDYGKKETIARQSAHETQASSESCGWFFGVARK